MTTKKTTAKSTTIDALLSEMRRAPTKTHKVSDLIAVVKRQPGTVYSVIYGESAKADDVRRVRQTGRGAFALTAKGKVQS